MTHSSVFVVSTRTRRLIILMELCNSGRMREWERERIKEKGREMEEERKGKRINR